MSSHVPEPSSPLSSAPPTSPAQDNSSSPLGPPKITWAPPPLPPHLVGLPLPPSKQPPRIISSSKVELEPPSSDGMEPYIPLAGLTPRSKSRIIRAEGWYGRRRNRESAEGTLKHLPSEAYDAMSLSSSSPDGDHLSSPHSLPHFEDDDLPLLSDPEDPTFDRFEDDKTFTCDDDTHSELRTEAEKLDAAIRYLEQTNVSLIDLLEYIFNPDYNQGSVRWNGFFRFPDRVRRILDFWVGWRNSPTGRETVTRWAVDRVSHLVYSEGESVTASKMLQSHTMAVDEAFVLHFSMEHLRGELSVLCPTMTAVMQAFATTARQQRELTEAFQYRKSMRITAALLDLLGERSQSNSYVKHNMAIFLYATGASRQTITVLNTLGVCSSYPMLVGWRRKGEGEVRDEGRKSGAGSENDDVGERNGASDVDEEAVAGPRDWSTSDLGLLRMLSQACMQTTQIVANSGPVQHVYDNINVVYKAAEQIVGRKDAQENGTCATIFPLYDARLEDMQTADFLEQQAAAPPLDVSDILLKSDEEIVFRKCMIHTILRILVDFGGAALARFTEEVRESQPVTRDKIPVHRTPVHPLPYIDIDESTITGNAEVVERIYEHLRYDRDDPDLPSTNTVKIISGDQLSVSRIRSVHNNRIGNDNIQDSFADVVHSPGLFHAQLHLVFGVLEKHWGDQSAGARDPASLVFHNTVLDRKPITITSLPPYRVCRDLIMVSCYARVKHCLEIVTGCPADEYPTDFTFDDLYRHAEEIFDRYANSVVVDDLREARQETSRTLSTSGDNLGPAEGDMVLENAILFMRDSLYVREFTDAIKVGDSGRILLMIKKLVLVYRGLGRTKYAHEMLHLVHNLEHVWPKPLRRIVMTNWVVNPSGHPKGFIPTDLLQEHENLLIKTLYKAQGSNASPEWLESISPCVNLLQELKREVYDSLGSRQGSRHAPPDLSKDIERLLQSLRMHQPYALRKGRNFEAADGPVTDAVVTGLNQLGAPLAEYNLAFESLRMRRRVTPLVGDTPGWAKNLARGEAEVPEVDPRRCPPAGPPSPSPTSAPRTPSPEVSSGLASSSSSSDDSASSRYSWSSCAADSNPDTDLESTRSIPSCSAGDVPSNRSSIYSPNGSNTSDMSDEADQEDEFWLIEPVFSLDTEDDVDLYMY